MYTKTVRKPNKNKRISPSETAFIGAIITLIGGFFISYNYIESQKIMAYDYMANAFYDGNQVTVTFNSKLEIDSKYLNGEEEKTRKNSYETSGEEITLQKINNEWKVVSWNLRYYGNNYYTVDSDMMVY